MENTVEAPRMPDLPAMSAPVLSAQPMRAMQPYGGQSYQPPTRHLRRFLGIITGGGLALALAIVVGENVLKDGLRPSQLLAQFESSLELGIMNGKLPVGSDGKPITNQGEYERELAKARAEGQAEAQLEYQEKLAEIQADTQRVVGAYTALYQRTSQLAAIAFQMEQDMQRSRAATVQQGQAGRAGMATLKDFWCGLSSDSSYCESAANDRRAMVNELNDLAGSGTGSRVEALMANIPDPASLIVRHDSQENGTPNIRRRR